MMHRILTGFLEFSGVKKASNRLEQCRDILARNGFCFPPLFFGTLNVRLEHDFLTHDVPSILIAQEEIEDVAPGFAEWWRLIPIVSLNSKSTSGFILRTRQNCHGNRLIEIVTEDVTKRTDIRLIPGAVIEVVTGNPDA
jgi:CTP-dependent riboflavin kinase